jgi:rhamnulokinase
MRLLAFDLGAESGRGMLGLWDGARLRIEELGRFRTEGYESDGSRLWDVERMFGEMSDMLDGTGDLASVGVDTWGVDYGLIGKDGKLVHPPVHYRDHRTDGIPDRVRELVSDREFYSITGIQFMQLNTVYQLVAEERPRPGILREADRLLMMPDLFNYLLCREQANELTIASTSQLLDARSRDWSAALLKKLDIPSHLFETPIRPGARLGRTRRGVPVHTVGCHDTASAVASVPARGDGWCYISSGTWSLLGAELASPILTPDALQANFTNEAGVKDTIRFLKNIYGLWILQQCRKVWAERGYEADYAELTREASASTYAGTFDATDDRLLAPDDMVATVNTLLDEAGHAKPDSPGDTVRACLASLAEQYAATLHTLERLTSQNRPTSPTGQTSPTYHTLHIVGGGSKNALLNQLAADACGLPVIAGPAEATAIGNLLCQLIGLGEIADLEEARAIVRTSFPDELREFVPGQESEI